MPKFIGVVLNFSSPTSNETHKIVLGRNLSIENHEQFLQMIKQKINDFASVEFDYQSAIFEYEDQQHKGSFFRYTDFDQIIKHSERPIQMKISSIGLRQTTPSPQSQPIDFEQVDPSLTQILSQTAGDEFTDYSEDTEDKVIYGDAETMENNNLVIQRMARWNGRYEPQKLLGAGSFGEVYLCNEYAFNGKQKGTVAVKLIHLLGSVEDFNKKIKVRSSFGV